MEICGRCNKTKDVCNCGRPTKYKAEMCDTVIAMGKEGCSKHEMALKLDIAMSTFQQWEENNPQFTASVKQAVSLSQGVWEQHSRNVSFGRAETNAVTLIFNMKNRFKKDWSDTTRQEVETTTIVVKSEEDKESLEELDA